MSNCGLVEFLITDGTFSIDMLAGNKGRPGFSIQRYTPGRPQLKNGGAWQDDPLTPGRQLAIATPTNTADALSLVCGGNTQADIIKAFEELDLLLDKATAFWTTTWQQTPIYIQARAKGETSRRYALIHYAKFDEYFNPYGELFAGAGFKLATEEFILGIERGLWLDLPPGEYETVAITNNMNSGDPIDQTGDFVILSGGNQENVGLVIGNMGYTGLQSVLRSDAGAFSGNLLAGDPPYNLVNAPAESGDAVYFGSLYPFYNLVLELSSTAAVGISWEYWDGATWSSLGGGGGNFNTPTGIRVKWWRPGNVDNWEKTLVGTDMTERYWVRARLQNGHANAVTQANRHVYTGATSYVEIDDDEVVGTKPGLLRVEMLLWTNATGTPINSPASVVIMGLRSVERGELFSAHWSAGDNPPGVVGGGVFGGSVATNDPSVAGGRIVSISNSTDFSMGTTWSVSSSGSTSVYNHYFGRFRLFARLSTDDDTGSSQARYTITTSSSFQIVYTGLPVNIPTAPSGQTAHNILVDLGTLQLPASDRTLYTDPLVSFTIRVGFNVPSGQTVSISSLILIPSDEWIGEITNPSALITSQNPHLVADGITNPKAMRAYFVEKAELLLTGSGMPILHAGTRQRLWFAFNMYSAADTTLNANASPAIVGSIRIGKVDRNIALRRFV